MDVEAWWDCAAPVATLSSAPRSYAAGQCVINSPFAEWDGAATRHQR